MVARVPAVEASWCRDNHALTIDQGDPVEHRTAARVRIPQLGSSRSGEQLPPTEWTCGRDDHSAAWYDLWPADRDQSRSCRRARSSRCGCRSPHPGRRRAAPGLGGVGCRRPCRRERPLLASASPACGQQFEPEPQSRSQEVTSDVLDLTVSASVEPARPGPNLVQLRVLETRRPAPGAVDNVTFRMIGGDGSVIAVRHGVPVSVCSNGPISPFPIPAFTESRSASLVRRLTCRHSLHRGMSTRFPYLVPTPFSPHVPGPRWRHFWPAEG